MVVAGIPPVKETDTAKTSHVQIIANIALEMRQVIFKIFFVNGIHFSFCPHSRFLIAVENA